MATTQSQVLEMIEKYPCGIPKNKITNCPGKHYSTNIRYTQGPCIHGCSAYDSELHETFYHKLEDFWEPWSQRTGIDIRKIRTEAERVRVDVKASFKRDEGII